MSRIKLALLLCVATCVGTAGVRAFARQKPDETPSAVKGEPGKVSTAKWRYQLVRLVYESELAVKANEQAEKGWEVVQVVLANDKSLQYSILLRRSADVKD